MPIKKLPPVTASNLRPFSDLDFSESNGDFWTIKRESFFTGNSYIQKYNYKNNLLFTDKIFQAAVFETREEALLTLKLLEEDSGPNNNILMQFNEVLAIAYTIALKKTNTPYIYIDKDWFIQGIDLDENTFFDKKKAEQHLKEKKIELMGWYQDRIIDISKITLDH